MSDWQSIDTAPKDGSYIIGGRFSKSRELKWVMDLRWITAAEAAEDDGFPDCEGDYIACWTNDGADCYPTHWMPLPAPADPTS